MAVAVHARRDEAGLQELAGGRGAPAAWLARIGLVSVTLAAGYQLVCSFQSMVFLNQHALVMDDAYYYFQIARNVALHGRVTFDGLHATSGIQLLWAGILSLVALVFSGRIEFLRATLVLSTVLNVLAGVLLWRLGRKLYSAVVGNIAALLWSGLMFALWPTLLGMEYSLHIVIIIATISTWWDVLAAGKAVAPGRLLLLGSLLTLNYWNRLDSALLSVLIASSVGVALWPARSERRAYLGRMTALAVVPAVGAIAYGAANLFLTGTLIPLSGMVKGYYAAQHFDAYNWFTSLAGHVLWWVKIQGRAPLDVVASVWSRDSWFRPLPAAVLALVLLLTVSGARQIYGERTTNPQRYRMAQLLGLLWVFNALHTAFVVISIGHFSHVTRHYYAWLYITWCLWGALLIPTLLSRLGSAKSRRLMVSLGLAVFVVMQGNAAIGRFVRPSTPVFDARRVRLVAWLDRNLPADARIGAWNAGVLGYFSKHTVVNLDGLANDRDFFRLLQSGAPITDYLRREQITYVVDINDRDLTMPYHASWDRSRLFRNAIPWSELQTSYVEPAQSMPVLVLRLKDTAAGNR